MRVIAVGTSGGRPTTEYGTSCIYLDLFGDKILLDCGEGSRQRLMRYDTSPDVDAVFLSHFYADHTLGLPGLVQALEMDGRDRPLDIYVPDGRTHRVGEMIDGAYRWPSYTIDIHGYGADEPMRQTADYTVRGFNTPYTEHSHGLVVQERERQTFLAGRARALGLDPGPKYGKLQNGQAVETDAGATVEPEDVLSEPRPGRKIVYTSDTRPTAGVIDAASDASLLVYSAMFAEECSERARSTGQSTATEAAEVAAASGSERLWLTHISPRHEGDEHTLETEAAAVFEGDVEAVRDGATTELTRG